MKKDIFFWLKFLFGVFVISGLFYYIGLKKIYSVIININLNYIPLIILLHLVVIVLGGLCIVILMKPLKHKISIMQIIKYYFISWSFGLFAPGKIGELSLVYLLKRSKLNLGKGAFILLMDKFITLMIIFFVSAYGLFLFFETEIALKMILLLLFFIILFVSLFVSKFGRCFIKKFILRKYSKKFKGFYKIIQDYLKTKKKFILMNFLCTLFRYILSSFLIYFVFLAFGVKIKILAIFIITIIMVLLSLVPITISGLGVREASAVFLYGLIGARMEIVASVYAIIFLLNYITATVVTLIMIKDVKKGDLNVI